MRIVLANQPWAVFGGSETYLLTIAPVLDRLGHHVDLFAPAGGEVCDRARERGIRVIADPERLPREPQAVIVGDAESCAQMARRYPNAVRVYVAHVVGWEPQIPPQLPGAYHAIVSMNDGTERLAKSAATPATAVRLRQPVDLERFKERGEPAPELRRVLALGRQWDPSTHHHRVMAGACERLGVELRTIGGAGRTTTTPEVEIADADAVLGVGRCVVEAMASQRAAYVIGPRGAGGWVTAAGYAAIEARGFTAGPDPHAAEVDRICEDLSAYDPTMGYENRSLAAAHHSARRHVAELIGLIEGLDPVPVVDQTPLRAVARMVRMQWEMSNRLAVAEGDSAALRTENRRLAAENQRCTDESVALHHHLDAVVNGRRYRVAQRLGRPIDALRAVTARIRRPRAKQPR